MQHHHSQQIFRVHIIILKALICVKYLSVFLVSITFEGIFPKHRRCFDYHMSILRRTLLLVFLTIILILVVEINTQFYVRAKTTETVHRALARIIHERSGLCDFPAAVQL
jgi:hypothetical protein